MIRKYNSPKKYVKSWRFLTYNTGILDKPVSCLVPRHQGQSSAAALEAALACWVICGELAGWRCASAKNVEFRVLARHHTPGTCRRSCQGSMVGRHSIERHIRCFIWIVRLARSMISSALKKKRSRSMENAFVFLSGDIGSHSIMAAPPTEAARTRQ